VSFWLIPVTLISVLLILSLIRLNIPRNLSKEGLDDHESTLAYDRVSRWFFFDLIRFWVIRQLKRYPLRGKVVDAGCGPGYLTFAVAGKFPLTEITGIDLSQEMLELAIVKSSHTNLNSRVRFLKADVQQMPFQNCSIDFIISTLSLHHWTDPKQALEEFHRVLKPAGRLMIFDLRRDAPHILFYMVYLVQRFLVPTSIHRVNGGIGSFWSSYTPTEIKILLIASSFKHWEICRGWGWLYVHSKK